MLYQYQINMEALLILIPIFGLHLAEAIWESKYGDFKHYPSFLGQLFYAIFISWILPFTSIFQGILAFIAVRVWFDYMYNFAKNRNWSYVGKYAKTDLFIRMLEKRFGSILIAYVLLIVRLLVSAISIFFMIC